METLLEVLFLSPKFSAHVPSLQSSIVDGVMSSLSRPATSVSQFSWLNIILQYDDTTVSQGPQLNNTELSQCFLTLLPGPGQLVSLVWGRGGRGGLSWLHWYYNMLALKQEVHCLESLSSLSPAGTRVFIMNNRKLSTSISFLVLFLFLHLSITVLLLNTVKDIQNI